MRCPDCKHNTDQAICPRCGSTVVSDPDDTMDTLIERASIPNLAALWKSGKDRGLIKPQQEYGHTA